MKINWSKKGKKKTVVRWKFKSYPSYAPGGGPKWGRKVSRK